MKLPIYQVDAFTGQLFSGNPAAANFSKLGFPRKRCNPLRRRTMCRRPPSSCPEEKIIKSVGSRPQSKWIYAGTRRLRLRTSCSIISAGRGGRVFFSSKSGPLYVRKDGEILALWIFRPIRYSPWYPPQPLIGGLGAKPAETYRGRDDYMAVLDSEETILALCPDMTLLSEVPARGVIVTAPGREVDLFPVLCTPIGDPEDPVTGSAHTTLTPYWSGDCQNHIFKPDKYPSGAESWCALTLASGLK